MRRTLVITVSCFLAAAVSVGSVVLVLYARLPASPFGIKRGMSMAEVEACVGRPADSKITSALLMYTHAEWETEDLTVLFKHGRVLHVSTPDYGERPPPNLVLFIRESFSWKQPEPVPRPLAKRTCVRQQ